MHKLFTLNNGLRVIADKNEGVNSVSVGIMIGNGSRNEELNINGISHFLEHMMFKGTTTRTSKEIVESIENLGGQLNAYTSKEATCYYVKNLYTHLDLSLEVLSDMILNSTFDIDEIEREKGVVIEEINMTEDSPEDVLFDLHAKASYGKNSLSYPILGTIEKVKNLSREDLIHYVENRYTPNNSVISVCGKFDEEELLVLIEKYFGNWSGPEYKPSYEECEIQANSLSLNKEIEQLHITLGIKGLPLGHEKSYALTLLCNILGGGASAILFQKVREELGLCYNIYCYPQSNIGVGIVNIYTGLGKEYGERALEVIVKELDKFVQNGITEEQLNMNKEKIKANYILGLESTSSKMFSNAKQLLFRNYVRTEEDVLNKIDSITMDDVNYVLKECFGKGIINSAYVGANIDTEKLDAIIYKDTFAFNNKIEEI